MKSTLSKQFSRLFVVTIIIFVVISFAGCVKKLSPPSEGSNTLLVIPTEVVNKTPIERKYNYIMKFEQNLNQGGGMIMQLKPIKRVRGFSVKWLT